MSEHEHDFINIDNYPIICVDGTFLHFMDDYVSLILYQNRVYPPKEDENSKPELHREIVMDARLSVPTLQHIMMTANDGLKMHRMSKMMTGHRSFWADTTFADEYVTTEKTLQNVSEIDEDEALSGFFFDTFREVDDGGKRKFLNSLLILLETILRKSETFEIDTPCKVKRMFQNPNNNFMKCPHCNGLLINEEFSGHTCFRIKDVFMDDKRIWISDGKEWHRWYGFPPPKNKHPFKTPDDSTEPIFVLLTNLHIQNVSKYIRNSTNLTVIMT
jgi:hypothetical protein